MVAYNFKSQFAQLVETGRKLQTIRGDRRRHAQPGELIQLYTGMRTKKCRKLMPDPVCKAIYPMQIDDSGVRIDGIYLLSHEIDALAKADGFSRIGEFVDFFKPKYGRPLFLIQWDESEFSNVEYKYLTVGRDITLTLLKPIP